MTTTEPVLVTVTLRVKPGTQDVFRKELAGIRELCVAEPECLDFIVLNHADDPTLFLITETWVSREHFESVQMHKEYYRPYFSRVEPMWASPPELACWSVLSVYRKS